MELSAHFAKAPPASERGSPFAPLFAAKGPEVVPRLSKRAARGSAAAAAQAEVPTGL